MSAGSRRSPSGAMVVAIVALVVAMTGTAVAGSLAIDGSTIKKNSIPGNRLIDHTLTGDQINLGKLGTVPSAANSARLGGKPAASYLPASKILRWNFKMGTGGPAHRFTYGPLTFSATCVIVSGTTEGLLSVNTSESGTYVSDAPDSEPGSGTTLATTSPPYTITEAQSTGAINGNDAEFEAFDPAGKIAIFSTAYTIGVAVDTPGAKCRFFGHLINDA